MTRVDLSLVLKQLSRLPAYIETKLHDWAKTVEREGIESTRLIPGYHDEPLKGKWMGARSIRLNRSYRAIYIELKDGELKLIKIIEVNKHDY